jgi:hypothetical protein
MAKKIAKQTRYVLERLADSHRIRVIDGGGPWLCRWNDAKKEQSFYGQDDYVWQPVFNGLVRRGWIEEVHRTPGDWVYYGITERGREAIAAARQTE